jgi:putative acyl-CoA dehydrogenase
MECLGGNGYVEDGILARLYREAPVNAIWEGSGNVMCLDVLRAIERDRETAAALIADLARATSDLPHGAVASALLAAPPAEAEARAAVGRLALVAAAAALKDSAPAAVAEAFARSRLGERSALYGAPGIESATVELLLQRTLADH